MGISTGRAAIAGGAYRAFNTAFCDLEVWCLLRHLISYDLAGQVLPFLVLANSILFVLLPLKALSVLKGHTRAHSNIWRAKA